MEMCFQDDEITLDQLDFALKAVNNQLISDPEMDFVFHVSERVTLYCTNTQGFEAHTQLRLMIHNKILLSSPV